MCRKKKIKCDGKLPLCSHCENYKTECVFTQVEKKRTPPKGYVWASALDESAQSHPVTVSLQTPTVPSISRALRTG